MHISKLLDNLLLKEINGRVSGEVTGLVYHSDKVRKGHLFFALPGTKARGWEYAREAVRNGALAVVVEDDAPKMDLPCIRTPDVRLAMAAMAAAFYEFPSQKLRLIGVTGTNGKTTTTYLIDKLLEVKGVTSGLIGTVDYKIGTEKFPVLSTTPEAPALQALLARMIEKGASYAVMEVSSHALDWHRVSGCEFDIAVLTNITEDHLDFHHDFESYRAAKGKLFSRMGGSLSKMGRPKAAVLNRDDPSFDYLSSLNPVETVSYAVKRPADVYAENPIIDHRGTRFRVRTFAGDIELNLRLRGMFNVYNSLAAIATGLVDGMKIEDIKTGLEAVTGIPGRFEQVECGQDYLVIIDYAHTTDGLENVLQTARQLLKQGRLITVFGCGGERDRSKRSLMGEIAGKYSEICIVTSDNPRGEDPEAIVEEIIPGLRKTKKDGEYHVHIDRHAAIKKAVDLAAPGDIVIIAGKGHEEYQIFKEKTIYFSDRKTVEKLVAEKRKER
ncbi:MAG: UDP-N-acetylmuramoyl-L-alanyl-D-glutamate--2,6-diaminopimelate ligase [Dethiobacteria bacterium]